jgi:hypothetical protein
MNKISFNLIVGILSLITVIYSFFGKVSEANILMFEVNIWVYRLFWTVLTVGCFYDYSKEKKRKSE